MKPNEKPEHHQHPGLSDKTALKVFGALLALTAITVAVAQLDLGKTNLLIAFLVASIKACLVGLFFMNLRHDRRENSVMFTTSFVFLLIFVSLTMSDLFTRDNVYYKVGTPLAMAQEGGASTGSIGSIPKPWISTPQLVAKGKEVFASQCTPCHGQNGQGDGPAAAALNPKPRNFHSGDGWKQGRKPSEIFATLKTGIPGSPMASFASLPVDERWGLVHYVLSLGPSHPDDTPADLKKIGIDATTGKAIAGAGGSSEGQTISVDLAIERMATGE